MGFSLHKKQFGARLHDLITWSRVAFLVQLLVLLGHAVPGYCHGSSMGLALTKMDITPHNSFLDAKVEGIGGDLRDILHAKTRLTSSLEPLPPEDFKRAIRYFEKHLTLTQKDTQLVGQLQSINFVPTDQRGLALFQAKIRYQRAPELAVAPLVIRNSLFEYMTFPCLVITMRGQQATLFIRNSEATFEPAYSIVTPVQSALSYYLSGLYEFLNGPSQLTFLLALLLATSALERKRRLPVLGAFVLANTLAAGLGALGLLSVTAHWWALLGAVALLYIGIENWALKVEKAKKGSRLLAGSAIGGFIYGGLAAHALVRPEENTALCLMAFTLGTACVVSLWAGVILPIMDSWRRKAESGERTQLSQEAAQWLVPANRAFTVFSYVVLLLVSGLSFASAMQAKKIQSATLAKAQSQKVSNQGNSTAPVTSQTIGDLTTVHKGFTTIDFKSESGSPVAGRPTQWTLNVHYREDDETVNDFELMHAKLLHLIVVSNDLSWYTHIHPTYLGKGKFTITTHLPHAGNYRFYADFMPKGQTEHEVVLHEFKVTGSNKLPADPSLTPAVLKDGWMTQRVKAAPEGFPDQGSTEYEVRLMPMPGEIHEKEPLMLHYEVRDKSGKPLTDLQPYMGAMGHCVVLAPNPIVYLHVHPMSGKMSHAKMTLSQMLSMNMGNEKLLPASYRGGPYVMFHTFFPIPGLYKVWAQFKHQDKVITSCFVLKVL